MPREQRDAPTFSVKVGAPGGDKQRVDLSDRITALTFDDNEDKADKLTLTVNNFDLTLFDAPVIRKGTEIEVSWGYQGRRSPPRIMTIEKATGGTTLKIEAHDKAMALHKVQKCRHFPNTKRSQVALYIAQTELGFSLENIMIEDSVEVLEYVSQARMTDYQLMRDMARREGWDFYIDFDGFHFHSRSLDQRPLRTFVWYNDPGQGDLLNWNVSNDITAAKPAKIRVMGFDPLTKEPINVEGSNTTASDRTTLASVLELVAPEDAQADGETLGKNISTEWFIPTLENTKALARRQAIGRYKRHQLDAVELNCSAVGDPWLVAKSVVLIIGIGPTLSGRYYITNIKHKLSNGYQMSFKCKSDGKASHTVTAFEQTVPGQGTGVRPKAKKNEELPPGTEASGKPHELDPSGVAPEGAILLWFDRQGRRFQRDPATGETIAVNGVGVGSRRAYVPSDDPPADQAVASYGEVAGPVASFDPDNPDPG